LSTGKCSTAWQPAAFAADKFQIAAMLAGQGTRN